MTGRSQDPTRAERARAEPSGSGLAVRVEGLVHIYRLFDTDVVALRGVDLEIAPGETVTLFGPSGSGKSTLLAALAGLVRPSAGEIWVGDAEIGRLSERELLRLRSGRVATLLQGAGRNLLPYATAAQNIAFARRARSNGSRSNGSRSNGSRPNDVGPDRVGPDRTRHGRRSGGDPVDLLRSLGLQHLADRPLSALSGGELQQVAVATAVANAPGLLLADEPTSQLDAPGREAVLDLLQRVNEQFGTTVIVVTHDRDVGARLGRQIVMRAGRVGEEGRGEHRFVVVGADGTLQLPPAVQPAWPSGTLVEVTDHGDHLTVRRRQP